MTMKRLARSLRSSRMIRETGGSVAVEFALIALPFFMSILGLIYIGLLYWTSATLDKGLEKVAQLMYEGRPLCGLAPGAASPYNQSCLKDRLCEQTPFVLVGEAKCKAGALFLDLRVLKGDGTDAMPSLVTNGNVNGGAFTDQSGATPGKIVMLRAALEVPNLAWVGPGVSTDSGKRVVMAASAFRMRALTEYNNAIH
ncbi:TadE/TadG family type IV pilus assembly protein [Microvirga calopogonii]|uniref:TadE/TadG family type IV pilus assembly protein n=1 Tax=Microvirga calopogonii TaxID=2078013 RepID=UPI000E0DB879|nr:TadE/TadG family type IV pilus assembly protein [Microvirga calopogonii]